MEECDVNKDLGPYSFPFTQVIRYFPLYSVSEETSGCVCSNASYNHVEEMICYNVVLQLHVEVQVVIRICIWELNLLFEMTVVQAIQHCYLAKAQRSEHLLCIGSAEARG